MTYVPLQFGVEYLNSQNSGFGDSLYISTPPATRYLALLVNAAISERGVVFCSIF